MIDYSEYTPTLAEQTIFLLRLAVPGEKATYRLTSEQAVAVVKEVDRLREELEAQRASHH